MGRWAAAFVILLGALAPGPAHGQSGLNQRAAVYITATCEDQQTGAISEPQGTGFIFEKGGYILTAYHVVSCWDPDNKKQLRRRVIHGHIGSPYEPPQWTLDLRRHDEQLDVAILKILGLPREFPTLKMCLLRNPPPEMPFVAAGFPEGKPYQSVDGRIGTTEAGGGLWAAASPFTKGMSGGPVAHNGFVVGLVKGGHLKENVAYVTALSTIAPIHRARTMIEDETALRLSECPAGATAKVPPQPEPSQQKPGNTESAKPRHIIRDCPHCPEMVVVPAGSFMMGSHENEVGDPDERPQHRVTIVAPFAVARFATTFDEWDACVAGGGCNGYRPNDQGWGRGKQPVINVSWNDAKAYVAWLSKSAGKTYRLLSEAEREYVTRAGKDTPFWWGSTTVKTSQANYNGEPSFPGQRKGVFRRKTLPVDDLGRNPWGLYQVHGNVWEWVEDCYNLGYQGAPTDGSAWTKGNCGRRLFRGGSWFSPPKYLRAAYREGDAPDYRDATVGFRIARALE